jgi:hypothetical protein
MRQNALPILENFGVDLVLGGHSHAYERSYLIDGHYGDSTTFSDAMKKDGGSGRQDASSGVYKKPTYSMAPHEGAVYVVAGTAGRIGGGTLNHPAMYSSQAVLGSVVLDVDGNRLDATFLDSAGIRRDSFSILKGADGLPPSPTPYGGTPAVVPGTIQAENFDEGGPLVSYYDAKVGNSGGAYRATDVDIEPTADAGGGHNVGWTKPGEWLKYTVNVTASGTYQLDARVANIASGATFRVEVDGVDTLGPIAVPNTGGWQTFQTVTAAGLQLAAGQHVVRVVFANVGSGGGVGNFNWFRFAASTPGAPTTPYGGTPVDLPGIIQAENFDDGPSGAAYADAGSGNSGRVYRNTDVDIGPTSDPSSGGYYIGWTRAGEWVKYTVDVTETRAYALHVRVANRGSGAGFRIEVDGADVTGEVSLPDTGGWDLWQTLSLNVPLGAGPRVIRLVMLSSNTENAGAGNYGFLRFE